MIREIVSDQFRLSQKSLPATKEDLPVVQDLLDTIIAHATGCVGMAANMIGINKNIIIVNDDGNYLVMLNPEIIKTMGRLYETEEGCLSLLGVRKTTRYKDIEVEFLDAGFKKQRQKYSGWIAQIIQHEVDHCDGIVIQL